MREFIKRAEDSFKQARRLEESTPLLVKFLRNSDAEKTWWKRKADAYRNIRLAKEQLYEWDDPQMARAYVRRALRSSIQGSEAIIETQESVADTWTSRSERIKKAGEDLSYFGMALGGAAVFGARTVVGAGINAALKYGRPLLNFVTITTREMSDFVLASAAGGVMGGYIAGMVKAGQRALATGSPFHYPAREQFVSIVRGWGIGWTYGWSPFAAATGAAWAQAIPRSYITLPNGALLEWTLLTRGAASLAPIVITNTAIAGGEVSILGGDASDFGRAMTMAAGFTVFYGSLFGTLNMLPNLRGAQGYLQGAGGTYRYSVAYREPSIWGLPPEQIASRAWKVPRALPAASGRYPTMAWASSLRGEGGVGGSVVITDAVPPTHRSLLAVGDWVRQVTLPRGFPPYLLSGRPVVLGSSSMQPSVTALATADGPKTSPSSKQGERLNLAGVEDSPGGGGATISPDAVILQAKILAPTNPLAALSILEAAIPPLAVRGDTRGAIACLTAMEEIVRRVKIDSLELFEITSNLIIYSERLGRTRPDTLFDFRLERNKENLPEVLRHMAWAYDRLGQVGNAEQTREMISRLGPQSPAAADSGGVQTYIDEARAMASWGNASGALSYLTDVISSLIKVRRRDDAITCLAEAERILRKVTNLQSVDVALELAGLSKLLGQTGTASFILSAILKHISTVHAGTGHYDDVLYGIATTYAELGQIEDAKNTSARIEDSYLKCSTYLEIVETLLQSNQMVQATGVLEIVEPIVQGLSDSEPDLFVIADQLDLVADLLKGKGRPELAKKIRQLAEEIRDKGE